MQTSDYLYAILAPLLNHPECLNVVLTRDDRGILLSVDLHKDDMGIVIGKSGRTAECIRDLVRIVGMKANARVSVKINEPDGSVYQPKH